MPVLNFNDVADLATPWVRAEISNQKYADDLEYRLGWFRRACGHVPEDELMPDMLLGAVVDQPIPSAMVALYDVRRILGWRIGRTMSNRPNPAKYAVEEFRRVKAGYAKLRNEDPHWASIPLAKAPAFFAKLRHDDTLQARALELVILTGAREGMVLSATIDQFDLGAALWHVPIMHMKAREAFTIPLCGRALAIVEHVAGGRNDPTSLLFRTLRPYAGIKEARPFDGKVLRDRMHSEYDIYGRACTVHGWRTTLTEHCYDAGFTPDTADDMLAHKLPKVQGAYRRVQPIAQRTKVLSSWQDYLMRSN